MFIKYIPTHTLINWKLNIMYRFRRGDLFNFLVVFEKVAVNEFKTIVLHTTDRFRDTVTNNDFHDYCE